MNIRSLHLTLVLAIASCLVGARVAASQHLTKEWVERAAQPLVDKQVVDGLSIGFIEGEHWGIVHLGNANAAKQQADMATMYEIASISKVFTSLMLADAVVRKEIVLDAAADVPNAAGMRLPSRLGRSITWLDLSTHRSGLPRLPANLQPVDMKDPYRDYDSKMAAAFLSGYELPRPPGETREYSNFGVAVLGYLLAERAGKTYEELLRERISEPLKLADCTVALTAEQRKRLATPHEKFGVETPIWTSADLPGDGGIYTTMRDMMRFAKAQLNPPEGTLGEAIELAWSQHAAVDESGMGMGLGWMIAGDGETRWHNGGTGGSSSSLFINRRAKTAVVILCNTQVAGKLDLLAAQLLQKGAGVEVNDDDEAPADQDDEKLVVDANLRGRLVGRYQLAPDFIFDVQDRDGRLMVGITNQSTQEVFADSPTRWSYRGVEATLEFKLPKKGRARSLVLHQGGVEQTARRIK